MSPWRFLGWSLLAGLSVALSFSYMAAETKPDDDDESPDNRYETKIDTPMIGDYTTFAGLQPVQLEGVGLIVGLAGTGGDPAPSMYRTALMNDMKRRGIPNPNAILQSPTTALVVIRAYLPPLMKKGETIDVEVRIPDSAGANSLAGGWLMDTYLTEQAIVPGQALPLQSFAYARAQGAVLTAGIGSESSNAPELLKMGRVQGGAIVMKERELAMYLRHDFRSIRNSQRLADVIGRRFHGFDEHGIKMPMAKAKTDQKLVLNVHPRYKDNYPRYLQVIRHMAFRETPVAARVRIQKLQEQIYQAERAEASSLELEAIGNEAIPVLKQALTSPLLEVRFHAAMALAYLGNSDGLPALVESVRNERAFRVYALAAIATLDDAEAHLALRDLMNESNAETRYGSFRALWTLDKRDPFIRAEVLGGHGDDEENPNRHAGEYTLHALQSTGDPLVHALTWTRPEIVLFGANQEFRAPMYLSAGRHIIVTAQPGATTVSLAKFEVGKPDQRRETSMQVADVIRAADELGASYPDVLQMLADASKQKNLPTSMAIDELPEGGRVYYRPDTSAKIPAKKRRTRIGRENMAPNLFPERKDPAAPGAEKKKSEDRGNMASVPEESASQRKSTSTNPSGDETTSSPSTSSRATTSRATSSRASRDETESENEKPKGLFSWLGNWRKVDK